MSYTLIPIMPDAFHARAKELKSFITTALISLTNNNPLTELNPSDTDYKAKQASFARELDARKKELVAKVRAEKSSLSAEALADKTCKALDEFVFQTLMKLTSLNKDSVIKSIEREIKDYKQKHWDAEFEKKKRQSKDEWIAEFQQAYQLPANHANKLTLNQIEEAKEIPLLEYAVELNLPKAVEALIEYRTPENEKFDINHTSPVDRKTALHRAAELGNKVICDILLDKGARTDLTTADGQTAVHLAACKKYGDIVKALINKSVDLTSTDSYGSTPLQLAMRVLNNSNETSTQATPNEAYDPRKKAEQTAQLILDALPLKDLHVVTPPLIAGGRRNPPYSYLEVALENSLTAHFIKKLLNKNPAILHDIIHRPNSDALQPLFLAVNKNCDDDVIILLFEHNVDVHACDKQHRSALQEAIVHCDAKKIDLFLAADEIKRWALIKAIVTSDKARIALFLGQDAAKQKELEDALFKTAGGKLDTLLPPDNLVLRSQIIKAIVNCGETKVALELAKKAADGLDNQKSLVGKLKSYEDELNRLLQGDNKKKTAIEAALYDSDAGKLDELFGQILRQEKSIVAAEDIHKNSTLMYALMPDVSNPRPRDDVHLSPLKIDLIKQIILRYGEHISTVINAKNGSNNTPLFYAVENKCPIEVLDLLVEHGADLNALNQGGITVLHLALAKRDRDRVAWLLKQLTTKVTIETGAGIDSKKIGPNETTLILALKNNCGYEVVKEIIRKYGDTISSHINKTDKDGKTALFIAIESMTGSDPAYAEQQKNIITLLIRCGANINIPNKEGRIPLHQALINKQTAIATQLLAEDSIEVDATDKDGNNTLMIAVSHNNHLETVTKTILQKYKLKTEAELSDLLNKTNKSGKNVLFAAIAAKTNNKSEEANNNATIDYLVMSGADPTGRDANHHTTLFRSIAEDKKEVAEFLMEVNLTVNNKKTRVKLHHDNEVIFTDQNQDSALSHALMKGFSPQFVRQLITQYGENIKRIINTHNKHTDKQLDHRAPLYIAISKKYPTDIIELLLSVEGINVNAKNTTGEFTALHSAISILDDDDHSLAQVELLVSKGADFNLNGRASTSFCWELFVNLDKKDRKYAGRLFQTLVKEKRVATLAALKITPLHQALYEENIDLAMVDHLIGEGADVMALDIRGAERGGVSPLQLLKKLNNTKFAGKLYQILIREKHEHILTALNLTPLHRILLMDDLDAANTLIGEGFAVPSPSGEQQDNLPPPSDKSALTHSSSDDAKDKKDSAEKSSPRSAEYIATAIMRKPLLLSESTRQLLNKPNSYNVTPAQLLLELNTNEKYKECLLHQLIIARQKPLIIALLENENFNFNNVDPSGATPLLLAVIQEDFDDIVNLLLSKGAKADTPLKPDKEGFVPDAGDTVVHVAGRLGKESTLEIFKSYPASKGLMGAHNSKRETPVILLEKRKKSRASDKGSAGSSPRGASSDGSPKLTPREELSSSAAGSSPRSIPPSDGSLTPPSSNATTPRDDAMSSARSLLSSDDENKERAAKAEAAKREKAKTEAAAGRATNASVNDLEARARRAGLGVDDIRINDPWYKRFWEHLKRNKWKYIGITTLLVLLILSGIVAVGLFWINPPAALVWTIAVGKAFAFVMTKTLIWMHIANAATPVINALAVAVPEIATAVLLSIAPAVTFTLAAAAVISSVVATVVLTPIVAAITAAQLTGRFFKWVATSLYDLITSDELATESASTILPPEPIWANKKNDGATAEGNSAAKQRTDAIDDRATLPAEREPLKEDVDEENCLPILESIRSSTHKPEANKKPTFIDTLIETNDKIVDVASYICSFGIFQKPHREHGKYAAVATSEVDAPSLGKAAAKKLQQEAVTPPPMRPASP